VLRRTRRSSPAAEPRRVTALEYYGAKVMPDYSGWWVYALGAASDGHVFYAGQSNSLLRRLDDHRREYPELFDWAQVYLIPVTGQAHADRVELELIDYYQPECNVVGRADELAAHLRRENRPLKPGHQFSPRSSPRTRSLDSGQAVN
jgi:hypothetical protein